MFREIPADFECPWHDFEKNSGQIREGRETLGRKRQGNNTEARGGKSQ